MYMLFWTVSSPNASLRNLHLRSGRRRFERRRSCFEAIDYKELLLVWLTKWRGNPESNLNLMEFNEQQSQWRNKGRAIARGGGQRERYRDRKRPIFNCSCDKSNLNFNNEFLVCWCSPEKCTFQRFVISLINLLKRITLFLMNFLNPNSFRPTKIKQHSWSAGL